MPAGDLLTTITNQFELGGYLFGAGCPIRIDIGGPTGWRSTAPVRPADEDRTFGAGVAAGVDTAGARVLTWPLICKGYSPAVMDGHVEDVLAVFEASDVDVELHAVLAGRGHVKVTGRPRGITEAPTGFASNVGIWRGQAIFVATDPAITLVP